MKALSIKQPWAYAILHCGKDIENREWYTKYRGQFLIHAPLKYDHEGGRFIRHELAEEMSIYKEDFPVGGIVGMATITDCVTKSDSKWFFGKYGFVLKDAKELPFMAVKGQLGFFEVNYDFSKKLRASSF